MNKHENKNNDILIRMRKNGSEFLPCLPLL
jgi:hypothetical protein